MDGDGFHVWIGTGAEFGKCCGVMVNTRCKLVIQQCCLDCCTALEVALFVTLCVNRAGVFFSDFTQE